LLDLHHHLRHSPKGKYMSVRQMLDIREYVRPDGRTLFSEWFDRLNSDAARRVATAMVAIDTPATPNPGRGIPISIKLGHYHPA
jgi:hypothetical protein